jgi:DNA-binding NtrC family response regulator
MNAKSLLLVDDDPDITTAISAALDGLVEHIVVCNDIESAEVMIESTPFDGIISDIRLSGPFRFEGLDFVGFVRRHQPSARVLLMSGDISTGLAAEARSRGASGVLQKPFDTDEVERILGSAA